VLEIYRKFVGDDPLKTPMRIFPGMHYSMGGIWVGHSDDKAKGMVKQMTNVPGTFGAGEVDFQYHGANRLGANSLLSCIYGGFLAGERAVEWATSHPADVASSVLDSERSRQSEITERIVKMAGPENPWQIHRELGDAMSDHCTVVRDNKGLDGLLQKIAELEERWEKCSVNDTGASANQAYFFTRAVKDMLILAKAIAKSARQRDECRGAHYKPEFELKKPEGEALAGDPWESDSYRAWVEELKARHAARYAIPPKKGKPNAPEYDEFIGRWVDSQRRWMKTTVARHTADGPDISFDEVAVTTVAPVPRIYK
jgi:succinate dehydrogenase / fumarate reductase flavoprotein subunit